MAETNLSVLKSALDSEALNEKFQKMLGKKSSGFMTSIMTVVQNSNLLQKAPSNSIILAAGQAAALDLPISPALGLAAIVPFKDNKNDTVVATFQIMKNGWVELALRTGQFEYLVCEPVYEGELISRNRFTEEYVFDETKRISDKLIGYMAAFKLTNGYHKTVYWTVEELKKHALRYSQTFKKGYGLWATDFEAMCAKTVIKNLIVKYAPKSIENLNLAIESDQASFNDDISAIGHATPRYIDTPTQEKKDAQNFQEAEVVESKPTEQTPKETPQKRAPRKTKTEEAPNQIPTYGTAPVAQAEQNTVKESAKPTANDDDDEDF